MDQSAHENPGRRLDSWKEIASFFARDERTVRRWEKEQALPVHRIPGGAKGRVFAYESELRKWLTSQAVNEGIHSRKSEVESPTVSGKLVKTRSHLHSVEKLAGVLAACGILIAALAFYLTGHPPWGHASATTNNAARGSSNSEAEDLYLKGRYFWNKRTPDDLNRAVDYFTHAIVRDPGYAKAYAGLADCYNLLREYSAMPDSEAYPRALAAATKAVELDDNLAEAHTSLAFVTFFWNWDAVGAEREFKHALALNPADARAHHWYASFLLTSRRVPEALAQIETARRLDPSSVSILADKGLMLSAAGQTDDAVTLLKQIQDAEPSFASSHKYLSQIYFNRQDYDDYLSEWEKTALLTRDQQELASTTWTSRQGGAASGSLSTAATWEKPACSRPSDWPPAPAQISRQVSSGTPVPSRSWSERRRSGHRTFIRAAMMPQPARPREEAHLALGQNLAPCTGYHAACGRRPRGVQRVTARYG